MSVAEAGSHAPRDPQPGGARARQRVIDTCWLILLVSLSATVGVVAYADPVHLDPAPLAWSLFGYGACYAGLARALSRTRDARLLALGAGVAQAGGVLLLGFLWYRLGGMQNPALLLAFAVPVIAGAGLPGAWPHHATALLSVVVVSVAALLEAPDLLWYVSRAGGHLPAELLPRDVLGVDVGARPFSDVRVTPGQRLALLAAFAFGMATLAAAAGALRLLIDGLAMRARAAEAARASEEQSAREWLRSGGAPALLAYADTGTVVDVSDGFEADFGCARAQAVGRNLFELVEWSHPDVVEELVRAGGGEAKAAVHRIDDRLFIARVRVRVVRWRERDCAWVTIDSQNAGWLLDAVLDALDAPVLVVGPDQRVAYANPAARRLFPGARQDEDARDALRVADLPDDWWRPDPLRRRGLQLPAEGGPRRTGTATSLRFPGERAAWTLLAFAGDGRRR